MFLEQWILDTDHLDFTFNILSYALSLIYPSSNASASLTFLDTLKNADYQYTSPLITLTCILLAQGSFATQEFFVHSFSINAEMSWQLLTPHLPLIPLELY